MGIGIVLVYLLIAAMAAPVAWLIWWGLDSIASRPARSRTSPSLQSPRRSPEPASAGHPSPADVNLPIRGSAVTVYSRGALELGTCEGPDSAGLCPRRLADGTVPCAGNLLALPRRIHGSFEWQIPAGYRTCLLGSYDAYRQKAPVAGAASGL